MFDIRTRNGNRDVVSGNCVERSDFRGNLPKDCKFEIRRDGRKQTVYGASCLHDDSSCRHCLGPPLVHGSEQQD